MARIDIRRPAVWIPGVIALLFLAVFAFRVRQASTPTEPPVSVEQIRQQQGVPVEVEAVRRGELTAWRAFSGNVSGAQEGVVRARSGDEIVSVAVDVGDRVTRGQVLVRQSGEGSAARLRQAQAARAQAERTVDRLRPLREAGAISEQEWEQAMTQLELATADVSAAADVLILRSPLAGIVTEVAARPGAIPSPGDPLVRVADLSELIVYLRLSASEVGSIRQGQAARLGSTRAEGQVRRVALQADPASRLVEVEVAFPPGAGLVPGTLATVEIRVDALEDALQVPGSAIFGDAVWVVDDEGIAQRRPVRVLLRASDRVAVEGNLREGERVVVSGGSLLSEGTRVQVVETGSGGS